MLAAYLAWQTVTVFVLSTGSAAAQVAMNLLPNAQSSVDSCATIVMPLATNDERLLVDRGRDHEEGHAQRRAWIPYPAGGCAWAGGKGQPDKS